MDAQTSYFCAALDAAAEQVKENIPVFGKEFPLPCTRNGVYSTDINTDWTPGFYTGMCWLAYEATGEDVFRTAALQQVDSFAARLVRNENLDHHDLGFLYTPSCVAGYQLTGSTAARNAALEAAARLTKRYQPIGQFLQAWGQINDRKEYRLIIDCLLNLPLLWWAAEQTGDARYAEIARAHTATAANVLFRPDGSTSHTCYVDPVTGKPVRAMTAQGYRADSAWARGQAWGILGMALAYRFTHEPAYLEQFRACAAFFLKRLPEDNVPYWDLIFTEGDEPRDSSAAAIAACGLYEALPYLPEAERAAAQQAADRLLTALVEHCAAPKRPGGGVLLHGVYCKASPYNTVTDYGVDEANLWGDYFYMEALTRRTRNWRTYWA